MITARDMAITTAPAVQAPPAQALPLRERILLVVLYVTVLASSVAFIEPSPHDALMGVLAVACLIAGVRFHRALLLPFMLLLLWNLAGLMALFQVVGEEKTIQYSATSAYLAIAAMLFAMLFAQNSMARLASMRAAYISTAIGVSFAGIAGYFNLLPGAHELFAPTGRALGTFKDPNVFGPFLIWPTLIVLERMISRRVRVTDLIVSGILLFALLLSFSRGAWFHFGVSCSIMLALAFLTAPTQRTRMRIIALSIVGVVALAGFIAILLSFDSIGSMFQQRAQLIQSYDVGDGGRFRLQELALTALLNYPNGMGPFEFARVHGLQQHNVYLQAFLVYGWFGGVAYVMLLIATFWMALRTVFTRTPWQPYLITAFAVFVGEVLEGFVIDTDHWRHFFLLLGMIWGLGTATMQYIHRRQGLGPAVSSNGSAPTIPQPAGRTVG